VKVTKAEFTAGAQIIESLPKPSFPEVALIGRSNVGKSTLVNRMTSQRKLARTSVTPGRTQQLNFFEVRLESKRHGKSSIFLVDLPGFGFAKLNKDRREEISETTVRYLHERESLSIVCLLNDVRRLPEADELALRDLAFETERSLLIVLTKADKLSRNELANESKKVAAAYGLEVADLVVTGDKLAIEPLWERIVSLLEIR